MKKYESNQKCKTRIFITITTLLAALMYRRKTESPLIEEIDGVLDFCFSMYIISFYGVHKREGRENKDNKLRFLAGMISLFSEHWNELR